MMKLNLREFDKVSQIEEGLKLNGFYLVERCFSDSFCDELRSQVLKAVEHEAKEYPSEEMFGRILFAPVYGKAFLEVLEFEQIFELADKVLGCESIIYTMTSSCLPPKGNNYTSRIHIDTHIEIGDLVPSLGIQIMLNNFTPVNGAPQFLPLIWSSSTPTETDFHQSAQQIEAPKGSILFFDTRCWHRSTVNKTEDWRCSLLIACCRNWMKQRFDVVEMLKRVDLSNCSEKALKRLGLSSHPPGSYDDFFRSKQRF